MYAVDIPNSADPADAWINLDYFPTREEAIAYAQEILGADENGRIGVVSEIEDEDDD